MEAGNQVIWKMFYHRRDIEILGWVCGNTDEKTRHISSKNRVL
jgi:hypothetical protein